MFRYQDFREYNPKALPRLEHFVIAASPQGHGGGPSGIIVAGAVGGDIYITADCSERFASGSGWARMVSGLTEGSSARVVIDAMGSGELERELLRAAGCRSRVDTISSTGAFRRRISMVAALYEQGRIYHNGVGTEDLQRELLQTSPSVQVSSRVEALVLAVEALLSDTAKANMPPVQYVPGPKFSVVPPPFGAVLFYGDGRAVFVEGAAVTPPADVVKVVTVWDQPGPALPNSDGGGVVIPQDDEVEMRRRIVDLATREHREAVQSLTPAQIRAIRRIAWNGETGGAASVRNEIEADALAGDISAVIPPIPLWWIGLDE